jgi:hypothetical protein
VNLWPASLDDYALFLSPCVYLFTNHYCALPIESEGSTPRAPPLAAALADAPSGEGEGGEGETSALLGRRPASSTNVPTSRPPLGRTGTSAHPPSPHPPSQPWSSARPTTAGLPSSSSDAAGLLSSSSDAGAGAAGAEAAGAEAGAFTLAGVPGRAGSAAWWVAWASGFDGALILALATSAAFNALFGALAYGFFGVADRPPVEEDGSARGMGGREFSAFQRLFGLARGRAEGRSLCRGDRMDVCRAF